MYISYLHLNLLGFLQLNLLAILRNVSYVCFSNLWRGRQHVVFYPHFLSVHQPFDCMKIEIWYTMIRFLLFSASAVLVLILS